MTNGDKIRAMSDEELEKLLDLAYFCPMEMAGCPNEGRCSDCRHKWLKQEAEP